MKPKNSLLKGKFSFKYFILKSNTMQLYREIFKYAGKIQNNQTRNEMREYIRSEFVKDSNQEYDESTVEYKLGLARKQINMMKQQIDMIK